MEKALTACLSTGGKHQYVTYVKKNYQKSIEYETFAAWFTAEFFEPDKWADLFAKSGAKYVLPACSLIFFSLSFHPSRFVNT